VKTIHAAAIHIDDQPPTIYLTKVKFARNSEVILEASEDNTMIDLLPLCCFAPYHPLRFFTP